jgi:hypothetical protein
MAELPSEGSLGLPVQVEDYIHDAAPGGLTFSDAELPVVSVIGGSPMVLGGYSPDPGRTPQVSNEEDPRSLSWMVPPQGIRR